MKTRSLTWFWPKPWHGSWPQPWHELGVNFHIDLDLWPWPKPWNWPLHQPWPQYWHWLWPKPWHWPWQSNKPLWICQKNQPSPMFYIGRSVRWCKGRAPSSGPKFLHLGRIGVIASPPKGWSAPGKSWIHYCFMNVKVLIWNLKFVWFHCLTYDHQTRSTQSLNFSWCETMYPALLKSFMKQTYDSVLL